jgi:hypothetical protein
VEEGRQLAAKARNECGAEVVVFEHDGPDVGRRAPTRVAVLHPVRQDAVRRSPAHVPAVFVGNAIVEANGVVVVRAAEDGQWVLGTYRRSGQYIRFNGQCAHVLRVVLSPGMPPVARSLTG